MKSAEARAAKERIKMRLQDLDGVSGIGLARDTNDAWVIVINVLPAHIDAVRRALDQLDESIPIEIEAVSDIHLL